MPLTVAHVSPTYYSRSSVIGGGERIVLYFAKALDLAARARGYDVQNHIVTFGEEPGRLREQHFSGSLLKGIPWQAETIDCAALRASFAQSDVVLVYQCLHPVGLFVGAHAKLSGKRVIGMDYGAGEHRLVSKSREAANMFDLLVASTNFNQLSFLNLDAPSRLIRGVVDTELHRPTHGPRNHTSVLAVGRLLPHKGFDRIVKALPDGLSLTICGSGYDDAYRSHLAELMAGKDVTLVEGETDEEIRSRMASSGLFVHASTHRDYLGRHYDKPELLGLAPLEAMSCGTPALVGSAGSLPELGLLDGCMCFQNDYELALLLAAHRDHKVAWPSPADIHDCVDRSYGLHRFGHEMLDAIGGIP